MDIKLNVTERTIRVSGRIKISTYRAGMVEAITPFIEQIQAYKEQLNKGGSAEFMLGMQSYIDRNIAAIEHLKDAYFINTAVECPNLIMDSPGYGIDLIIQRMVGINTYSLNILWGEFGTGSTTPALTDTALTAPTNRAAVGFQQNYGSTDAILQFFFSDSQLANQTYNEFGTFIDGTSTISSGQIFNHAALSPGYVKAGGQDTTVEVDFEVANS